MSFATSYKLVMGNLVALLEATGNIKKAYYGESFELTEDLPIAVLEPGDGEINHKTRATYHVHIPIDVYLIIQSSDAQAYFNETIDVMGDVVDAILAAPTIGGACSEAHAERFIQPGAIRISNTVYYGGIVRVHAYFKYP